MDIELAESNGDVRTLRRSLNLGLNGPFLLKRSENTADHPSIVNPHFIFAGNRRRRERRCRNAVVSAYAKISLSYRKSGSLNPLLLCAPAFREH